MGCSNSSPLAQPDPQKPKSLRVQILPLTEVPSPDPKLSIHDFQPVEDPLVEMQETLQRLTEENKQKDEQIMQMAEKLAKYQSSINDLLRGTQLINFEEMNKSIQEKNKQIAILQKRETKMKTLLGQRNGLIENLTRQVTSKIPNSTKPNLDKNAVDKISVLLKSVLQASYDKIASTGVQVPRSLLIFNKSDSPRLQKSYMKAVELGTDLTLLSYSQAIYHLNRIIHEKCRYDLSTSQIAKDLDQFFLQYVANQARSKVLANRLLVQLLLTLKSMHNGKHEYSKMIARMLNVFQVGGPIDFRLKTYLIKITVSLEKLLEDRANLTSADLYSSGGYLTTENAYKYLSDMSHSNVQCFQYFYNEFQDTEKVSKADFLMTFEDYYAWLQDQAAEELQRLYSNTCKYNDVEVLSYELFDDIMKRLESSENAQKSERFGAITQDLHKITGNSGVIPLEDFTWIMLHWGIGNVGYQTIADYFRVQNLALENSPNLKLSRP